MFRQAERESNVLRGTRLAACGALLALTAALVAPSAHAAPRPPQPTKQQLTAAQQAKNALATQVGQLSAQLAQATAKLTDLRAKAELAQQKYAYAISRLNQAKDDAVQAQVAAVVAQTTLDRARKNLKNYVRDSYMSPTIGSATGGLLTAKDPNALLQSGNYLQYVSNHRLDALSQMDRATVAKSNADAKAKQLVQLRQTLTDEANAAQKVAQEAFRQQQSEQARLQGEQTATRAHLLYAQAKLASLNQQKNVFQAWQAEQQRIAAAKALKERLAREAAQRAAAAAAAAQNNSGGGGGGGGGAPLPPAGSMGGWTAAKGQAAVNRALAQVGQTYIWAGGNYNGPTDGGCTDPVAACGTTGFDCSGLVLYAWAPQGLYMVHFAATQFSQAGSYHPGPGNFLPGDLLFWGLPGQYDIHHVAMYIGNGMVVQAPYSGTVVQVTPWDQVSGDYYGATRPLS